MNFDCYMPSRLISGQDCVLKNGAQLAALGQSALIVSTSHAAKACGALDDVIRVLSEAGIAYRHYDQIGQNPLLDACYTGGQWAIDCQADFIIGIGGGSAMDASKAICAFAADPSLSPMDLFGPLKCKPLPLVAIPTTAGTGSEANAVAVITLPDQGVKKSFKSDDVYPVLSFIDPKYTLSLNKHFTISTALDALCHCIESYMSPKSSIASEVFALEGGRLLLEGIARAEADDLSLPTRELLMYGATCGGIAINKTGTGFPHPLGYNLTLYYGVPHGQACAVFTKAYLEHCEAAAPERTAHMYVAMGTDGETLKALTQRLCGFHQTLPEEDVMRFTHLIENAGNFANSFRTVTPEEIPDLYRSVR